MQNLVIPKAALVCFSPSPLAPQNHKYYSNMADAHGGIKQDDIELEVRDMKLEQERDVDMDTIPLAQSVKKERSASVGGSGFSTPKGVKKQSQSPLKSEAMSQSPAFKMEDGDTKIGGEVELKIEPNEAPKLVRKTSQRAPRRPPPLFFDYEDKTTEATSSFSLLAECVYANKHLGTTEHALECDCAEEWGKS